MKPIDLKEHPEGGKFAEVYRSATNVTNQLGDIRTALTHIYFSLNPGELSHFHKVDSDEVWNLYKGVGIHLYTWNDSDEKPEQITLSAKEETFCYVVPAGTWQAAEPVSDSVLVGCSVAPGFEFSGFTLIDQDSDEAKRIIRLDPTMSRFI